MSDSERTMNPFENSLASLAQMAMLQGGALGFAFFMGIPTKEIAYSDPKSIKIGAR